MFAVVAVHLLGKKSSGFAIVADACVFVLGVGILATYPDRRQFISTDAACPHFLFSRCGVEPPAVTILLQRNGEWPLLVSDHEFLFVWSVIHKLPLLGKGDRENLAGILVGNRISRGEDSAAFRAEDLVQRLGVARFNCIGKRGDGKLGLVEGALALIGGGIWWWANPRRMRIAAGLRSAAPRSRIAFEMDRFPIVTPILECQMLG